MRIKGFFFRFFFIKPQHKTSKTENRFTYAARSDRSHEWCFTRFGRRVFPKSKTPGRPVDRGTGTRGVTTRRRRGRRGDRSGARRTATLFGRPRRQPTRYISTRVTAIGRTHTGVIIAQPTGTHQRYRRRHVEVSRVNR